MDERQYEFVDAQGKKYTWAESVLEDTILEGEDWDKPSVRKRIKALKPGKSMTIKGEKLTRVDKAKKNPDTTVVRWHDLDSAERIGLGLFDNMDGTYSDDAVAMQSKTARRLIAKGLVRPDPSGDVPPGRNRTYVYLTDEGRHVIASAYKKNPDTAAAKRRAMRG